MPTTIVALCGLFLFSFVTCIAADPNAGGALYPPGLLPLINTANALLSAGQFSDAVKAYSEAIGASYFWFFTCIMLPHQPPSEDLSPTDASLYYKRATAQFSLNRYANALTDFDQVLNLTSDSFDRAHLMKAKVHAKEGRWADARDSLRKFSAKVKNDNDAMALLLDVSDGEAAAKKVVQAAKAKLWTACEEAATEALRTASHSVTIRQQRAYCAIAAGDFEQAVGDLT